MKRLLIALRLVLSTCHLLDQRMWFLIMILKFLRNILLVLKHGLNYLLLLLHVECRRILRINLVWKWAKSLILATLCLFDFRKNLLELTLFDRIRFLLSLFLLAISISWISLNFVHIIIFRNMVKRINMLKYRGFIFDLIQILAVF